MAYPVVDAPYGLRPVNLLGGRVYAGAVRHIPIASGYDTSIFNGDIVKLVAAGTVEKDTGTATATPVGVFLGCEYTDPNNGQLTHKQHYPADTVADDIMAIVVDDPDCLFMIASVSSGTTIAGMTRSESVGANFAVIQNAGVAATGNSRVALDNTSGATTATLPLRVVDVVPETMSGTDYVEFIVKWNAGHQYRNATGLA